MAVDIIGNLLYNIKCKTVYRLFKKKAHNLLTEIKNFRGDSMQYESFAASLKGTDEGIVCGNYFINGICKDNIEEETAAEMELSRNSANIYAVSDSSASEICGDEAAYIPIEVLRDFVGADFRRGYMEYFDAANGILKTKMFEHSGKQLRADVAVLCIDRRTAVTYTVGGVAVYLLRSGKLTRLNDGVIETVDADEIADVDNGKAENRTVTVGAAKFLGVDTEALAVCPFVSDKKRLRCGDMLIICREDIIKGIGESNAASVLSTVPKGADPAARLIDAARKKGINGDITVEVIRTKHGMSVDGAMVRRGVIAASLALIVCAAIAFGGDVWSFAKDFARNNMVTFEKQAETEGEWTPIVEPEQEDNTEPQSETPAAPEQPVQPETPAQPEQPQQTEPQQKARAPLNPVQQNPIHRGSQGTNSGKSKQPVQKPVQQPAQQPVQQPAQQPVQQPAQPVTPKPAAGAESTQQPKTSGNELPMDF